MLNPFPDVMFLGPYFAPVILRIAVALAFYAIAERLMKNRSVLMQTKFPIIGTPGSILTWIWVGLLFLAALSFAAGFYVQIAAILGFFFSIKMWWFSKKFPEALPFDRLACFLLAALCLTLFITGAGAFAFDSAF